MARHDLIDASRRIEQLLELYNLPTEALAEPLDAELGPVIGRVLDRFDVTLEQVVTHLDQPAGDTLADLIDLVDQLLEGSTRAKWMSSLRFVRDGWHVLPAHLPYAIEAAEKAGLRVKLSHDPNDHPIVEHPIGAGKRRHPHLVLWEGYGDEPIDRVRRVKIEMAGKYKRADTLTRAAVRDAARARRGLPSLEWDGNGAVASVYDALTYAVKVAHGEGSLDESVNPLAHIKTPARGETKRHAVSEQMIDEVWRAVILHGTDPQLDRLLIKFLLHTGARRAGAINLTMERLNWERQSVNLLQKYGKVTEVPVCRTLLEELDAFARSRGSTDPHHPVFRLNQHDTATGTLRPLTRKHFETVHDVIKKHVTWAAQTGWTVHWARHQAKADIEGIAGPAAARKFLGHAPANTTEGYGSATFEHVAWAVSVRTGQPHPLAQKPWWLG